NPSERGGLQIRASGEDYKSERAGRIANPSERGGLQIRASGENKKFYIYIIKAKHIFFMLFAQKIRLYEL
ncbi:MAG TPA: hypothetical protein PKN53_01790, partial [Bacteroidales bacterium]|nr:hypothetical protein [Bacteroidales bacterium]